MGRRYFAWCPQCGNRRIDGDDYSQSQLDDVFNFWDYHCDNCGLYWNRDNYYYDYRQKDYVEVGGDDDDDCGDDDDDDDCGDDDDDCGDDDDDCSTNKKLKNLLKTCFDFRWCPVCSSRRIKSTGGINWICSSCGSEWTGRDYYFDHRTRSYEQR